MDDELPPGYELLSPIDQATVRHLVAAGADLRQPRHVLHYLYFPSADRAEQARADAESAGWESTVAQVSDADEWSLTCQRHEYVLLARTVHGDEQFFAGLARKHQGEHEGWEASVR